MAFIETNKVQIEAVVACIPNNIIENSTYPCHSESESELFIKTTGIERRRVVENNTTASDLCLFAARHMLSTLNIAYDDIQILIFVSQTPDYKIPCTATILQDKLKLTKTCMAFDVNLGCSGYVYGLSLAASLLEKTKRKALLLVGDASSTCVNQKDKTTAPLFSDAGSATLLSYNEEANRMVFNLQSDGGGFDAIITQDGGARNPTNDFSFVVDDATGRSAADMKLDGIKIFNFSRREVVPNIEGLLNQYSIQKDEIQRFVFHQANKLMNDTLIKKLGLENGMVPSTLKDYGNTGSASIPLTLCVSCAETEIGQVLFSGFGVGLSWASCVVNLNKSKIFDVLIYQTQ